MIFQAALTIQHTCADCGTKDDGGFLRKCEACGEWSCVWCSITESVILNVGTPTDQENIPICKRCKRNGYTACALCKGAALVGYDKAHFKCCACDDLFCYEKEPKKFLVYDRCKHAVCISCKDATGVVCTACGLLTCPSCATSCRTCTKRYCKKCTRSCIYKCTTGVLTDEKLDMCPGCISTQGVCSYCCGTLSWPAVRKCESCSIAVCLSCYDIIPHCCGKCSTLRASMKLPQITNYFPMIIPTDA